jgi:hypothetical protein
LLPEPERQRTGPAQELKKRAVKIGVLGLVIFKNIFRKAGQYGNISPGISLKPFFPWLLLESLQSSWLHRP